MKRLVFCFDGTWNRLSADTPTNVVLTAASIERVTSGGVPQLIHYDEGVGTGRLERLSGGMFGVGLLDNVREAYRFLIFNFDPGDEIFVFGFSRGAYTARTFIGLVRHAGVLRRLHAARIDEAIARYRARMEGGAAAAEGMRAFRASYADGTCIGADDDAWRCLNVEGYAAGSAPALSIRYLGVWDTVGALGLPAFLPGSGLVNRDKCFHDVAIDGFVHGARHAVAIDERRALFPLTTLGELDALNRSRGREPADRDAPYQERWFPGDHGSVGGGGDIRGLSDATLAWVLEGAKQAGLRLDTARGTRIGGFEPDPFAPLENVAKPEHGPTHLLKAQRSGPSVVWQLGAGTVRRWKSLPAEGEAPYRPGPLAKVAGALDAMPPDGRRAPEDSLATETVKDGDTLSRYAKRHYGRASLHPLIFAANPQIDDPDELFAGQKVVIPRLPAQSPDAPAPSAAAGGGNSMAPDPSAVDGEDAR